MDAQEYYESIGVTGERDDEDEREDCAHIGPISRRKVDCEDEMSETSAVEIQPKQEIVPATPMSLIQLAISRNADIDKLEKLMELQDALGGD